MSIGPKVKSSRVQFDGALLGVHQTSKIAFATTAQDNLAVFIAPCDLTFKRVLIRTLASSTSSKALFTLGDSTASNTFHSAVSLQNVAAGTLKDLDMSLATGAFTKVTMRKGEMLKVKVPAATAVGSFAATLVYAPTAGA